MKIEFKIETMLERLRRLAVVVLALLGPSPWCWGRVSTPIEHAELTGWGRYRFELLHGRLWLRLHALRRDGALVMLLLPEHAIWSLQETSEAEARRAVLPDPPDDGKALPCDGFLAPSCRPGRCAHCGFTAEQHRPREEELQQLGMQRTIAEILSKARGVSLVHWQIALAWDGADEADPPGKDQILDVRIRESRDALGQRIDREEWNRLMRAGIPLYPWMQASATWGDDAGHEAAS